MINNIKGLAIDFDEVMVETIDALVSIINEDYNLNVNSKDVKKWDFDDVFPNVPKNIIYKVFEDKRFFKRLKFKPNLIETLKKINKKYPIIIVTLGSYENLLLKRDFIKNKINSEGIKTKFIGLISGIEDKSKVNLNNLLFIDDHEQNLEVSNATIKILFENRKDAEWNKNWKGKRIKNISEILEYFDL